MDIQYIQGEKNVVTDALSRLPTEELFIFDVDEDLPLNLWLIVDSQAADEHLQTMLQKEPGKYAATIRDGDKIYEHTKTTAIYVPATQRASILQWHHTTLQHPGISTCRQPWKRTFTDPAWM